MTTRTAKMMATVGFKKQRGIPSSCHCPHCPHCRCCCCPRNHSKVFFVVLLIVSFLTTQGALAWTGCSLSVSTFTSGRSAVRVPTRPLSVLYESLGSGRRFRWDLPEGSDGDFVTDMLLEMGALTAEIVPSKDGMEASYLETDDGFSKTGRIRTVGSWTRVLFDVSVDGDHDAIHDDVGGSSVDSIVASVADICGVEVVEGSVVEVLDVSTEDIENNGTTETSFGSSVSSFSSSSPSSSSSLPSSVAAPITTIDVGEGIQIEIMSLLDHNDDSNETNKSINTGPYWAFGDGHHPSTRVCLDGLAREQLHGASVLDFGCGSGVLTVAALVGGARRVVAVDIEASALELTRRNIRHNVPHLLDEKDTKGPSGKETVSVLHGNDFVVDRNEAGPERFDLVVANIPANTLVSLLPTLAACAKDRVLLAGYPASEAEFVTKAANQAGLMETRSKEDNKVVDDDDEEEEEEGSDYARRIYNAGWVMQEFVRC